MEYRRLGRTGLKVSKLALGTMNFGQVTPEDASFRLLDKARDAGINFIDTADQYGGSFGPGATESLVGRWLATRADRDQIVLATKAHEPMGEGPNDRGLSAFHLRRACDASLRRLDVDHIDIYQLHHIDRAVAWDEIYEATDRLVAQGKITYLGTSNFPGWAIASGAEQAKARHTFGPVSEQHLYNLLQRSAELEVLPAAQHYGIGVIPWSPLGGGLLGGVLDGGSVRRKSQAARIEKLRSTLEPWEALCAELGHSPAAVATAWLMGRPGVTAPIVGSRTEAQLDDAISAVDVTLDDDVLGRIDELFPPRGAAPEAYAW